MPSVSVKLYSVFFKTLLKHKLLSQRASPSGKDGSAPVSRPSKGVPANASFVDGVATKDINIDPFTSLTLRIFLPESALPQELITPGKTGLFGCISREAQDDKMVAAAMDRRASCGGNKKKFNLEGNRRNSWGGERLRSATVKKDYARLDASRSMNEEGTQLVEAILDADPSLSKVLQSSFSNGDDAHENYQGYHPVFTAENHKKLPIIVQFHGGGFVTGSKDSMANDVFCRRMAKLCDAIVVAVGYRLAPEHKYPAAFDDGFDALSWLAKQANLAECSKSLGEALSSRVLMSEVDVDGKNDKELIKTFGGSTIVEPWLAAHGDPSRCVLLGVSSGGNIANFVARKAVQAGRILEPIKIVAQVLMYPFFLGSIPTRSEIKLANSYFYDKATCLLAWKLFFSDGEFALDHAVANPLVEREPPLKHMPPTLTIVGELDWMKDRAIAYSEALRKAKLDAPVLEYKDAVHEFATLDFLVKSRQAEVCAEDMAIWIKKFMPLKSWRQPSSVVALSMLQRQECCSLQVHVAAHLF